MLSKKLTILVAIYNVEKYLDKCLSSLSNISPDIALIYLIDDGSTDQSSNICNKFVSKFSHFRYFKKYNGGLVSVRKFGFNLVKTKYVAFVDGDDWIEEGYYEQLLKHALKNSVDFVAAGHKEEKDGLVYEISLNYFKSGFYENENLKSIIFSKFLSKGSFYRPGIYTYLWSKIFDVDYIKPFIVSVPNQITMGEDAAIFIPAVLNSSKIFISDAIGYHYVQHNKSITKTSYDQNMEYKNIKVLYNYLKNITQEHKFKYLKSQLDDYINSLIFARCWTVHSSSDFPLWPYRILCKSFNYLKIIGSGNYYTHLFKFFYFKKTYLNMKIKLINTDDLLFLKKCYLEDIFLVAQFAPEKRNYIVNKLINHGILPNKIYTPDIANEYLKKNNINIDNY